MARWTKMVEDGKPTRFKKGMAPWNKGLSGVQVSTRKGTKLPDWWIEKLRKPKSITHPCSEETKRKISEAQKGRVSSMKGKHHSVETIEKIRLSNIGKHIGYKHTEEAKRKISESGRGGNAYNWIADRTQLAKLSNGNEYRNSPAYKEWTRSVKNRDGWACRIADNNCDGKVVAHHILSWSKFPELRYQTNNGITLCRFHHPRKREDEVNLSPYFQSMVMSNSN